jgi:hypothetical protein
MDTHTMANPTKKPPEQTDQTDQQTSNDHSARPSLTPNPNNHTTLNNTRGRGKRSKTYDADFNQQQNNNHHTTTPVPHDQPRNFGRGRSGFHQNNRRQPIANGTMMPWNQESVRTQQNAYQKSFNNGRKRQDNKKGYKGARPRVHPSQIQPNTANLAQPLTPPQTPLNSESVVNRESIKLPESDLIQNTTNSTCAMYDLHDSEQQVHRRTRAPVNDTGLGISTPGVNEKKHSTHLDDVWAVEGWDDTIQTLNQDDSENAWSCTSSMEVEFEKANDKHFHLMLSLSDSQVRSIRRWLRELPVAPNGWDRPTKFYPVDVEIAPRQWAQFEALENSNLSRDAFWTAVHAFDPQPLDDEDIDRVPWWERYMNLEAPYLLPSKQRESPMDPNDKMYVKGKAESSTAQWKIAQLKDQKDKYCKGAGIENEESKPMEILYPEDLGYSFIKNNNQNRNTYRKPPVRAEFQGQASMYVRLTREADVPALKDLYNHFIENTWFVPERQPFTDAQMQTKLREVEAAGWPWLVAIERNPDKGNRGRRRGGRRDRDRQAQHSTTEKIMGFVYANDHINAESTDRKTAQIQIWVLPECQYSKVGTSLMDRLFFCLLKNYVPVTDTEYRVVSEPFKNAGGCTRPLHMLVASMQYAPNGKDEKRANLVCGFLEKHGFHKWGEQVEIGERKNLSLNRRYFQRRCIENKVGCHSEGSILDTDSIRNGNPHYISPEDLTEEDQERLRMQRLAEEEARVRRPLPLDWRPVARR